MRRSQIMVAVNNDYSFNIEVVNFAPEILTISSSPRAAVVGDTITITATAFDVEGDKVTYAFLDGTEQNWLVIVVAQHLIHKHSVFLLQM